MSSSGTRPPKPPSILGFLGRRKDTRGPAGTGGAQRLNGSRSGAAAATQPAATATPVVDGIPVAPVSSVQIGPLPPGQQPTRGEITDYIANGKAILEAKAKGAVISDGVDVELSLQAIRDLCKGKGALLADVAN